MAGMDDGTAFEDAESDGSLFGGGDDDTFLLEEQSLAQTAPCHPDRAAPDTRVPSLLIFDQTAGSQSLTAIPGGGGDNPSQDVSTQHLPDEHASFVSTDDAELRELLEAELRDEPRIDIPLTGPMLANGDQAGHSDGDAGTVTLPAVSKSLGSTMLPRRVDDNADVVLKLCDHITLSKSSHTSVPRFRTLC
jgi:hypothetical protein